MSSIVTMVVVFEQEERNALVPVQPESSFHLLCCFANIVQAIVTLSHFAAVSAIVKNKAVQTVTTQTTMATRQLNQEFYHSKTRWRTCHQHQTQPIIKHSTSYNQSLSIHDTTHRLIQHIAIFWCSRSLVDYAFSKQLDSIEKM